MSEVVAVEFNSPDGELVRIEWQAEGVERLDPAAPAEPWTLSGELDWDEVAAVRVFTGRLEDGGVAIAAIRPAGAAGHGEEAIAGVLVGDGGVEDLEEVLLSTEQNGEGAVRRVGLELYRAEAMMPLRIAGDATGQASDDRGGLRLESTRFELRAAGAAGAGRLDVLTRA